MTSQFVYITNEELKEYCRLKAETEMDALAPISKVDTLSKKYEDEYLSRTYGDKNSDGLVYGPNYNKKFMTHTCIECGKRYLTKRYSSTFCSRSCASISKARKIVKNKMDVICTCIQCGKNIVLRYSDPRHPRKFCSHKCRSDFTREAIARRELEMGEGK